MSYTAGKIKTFSCPNCSGSVAIHAVGISITAICKHCGCTIDVANENLKVISQAKEQTIQPIIAIGSRGILFDEEWQVIGYMMRKVETSYYSYSWEEYLLFNPWHGFRFLVCSDRHWSFVKMLRQDVKTRAMAVEYEGRNYHLFSKGEFAKVTYVLGEFYWRAKVGEVAKVSDFIAPPYVISKEENNEEIVWSHGTYIEQEVIKQAFNIPFYVKPEGVAPHQPSPTAKHLTAVLLLSFLFFVTLFIESVIVSSTIDNKTVFSQKIHALPEQKGQVILSEPIELTGRTSNVEITVHSPVSNNWLELNSTLVNDSTEESFDVIQTVEYYSGYDSEGSWSEGSHVDNSMLSAVPSGRYHLLLTSDAGAYNQGAAVDFDITVKRDVAASSNFFVAFLTLLLYPAILVLRHYSFEKKRWADSDYAPAIYRDSEDSDD